MRVFEELTPECDKTAQLFAVGLEQKEIAEVKFRAIATIKKTDIHRYGYSRRQEIVSVMLN